MKAKTRSRLSLLLKGLVSTGILALLATRIDLASVGATMSLVQAPTVAVALAVVVFQNMLTACRWSLVMRGMGVTLRFFSAIRAIYVGLLLNQCLPSLIGGDAYRVYWLRREGTPLAAAVRGILVDRISALLALVAVLAITLPLVLRLLPDPLLQTGLWLVVAAGFAGAALFFSLDRLPVPQRLERFTRPVGEVSSTARAILLHGRRAVAILSLAAVVQLLNGFILHLFATDLGLPLGLIDCILLVAPIALAAVLPISVAGWGVREGGFVAVLSLLGIAKEQAMALSLLAGLCALANGLLGLLPLALGGVPALSPTAAESDGASPSP